MAKQPTAVRGSTTGRPIMRLLDVLGKRWALRILWELRSGRTSFRALQARCGDISPTSLNSRIKELRALDLIDRTDDGYGYTPWGQQLGHQLLALNALAEDWDQGRAS